MAWGAAIAAGAQVLGKTLDATVFKKKGGMGPEATRNSNYLDTVKHIQAIVDGAKRAGIHPLAALGSSGVGGFALPAGYSGNSSIGLGDAIGSGLGYLGEALYEQDADRRDREERERINDQVRRDRAVDILRSKELTPERKLQLENMRLQNELLVTDIATSRSKLAGARAASIGGAPPTSVLVGPGGSTFIPVPGRTSAQDAEDQYGEAGDLIFGTAGLLEDFATGRVKIGPAIENPLTKAYDALVRRLKRSKQQPDYDNPIY